jgi:transposase-like protein
MREKARKLRQEQDLTIDEIAERLSVSRTTVYFWVGDMPRPLRWFSACGPTTPSSVLACKVGSIAFERRG